MEKKYDVNWYENPVFGAVYDPDTLTIIKVGQKVFFENETNLVDIDFDLAIKIIKGEIPNHRCFANLNIFKAEIIEERSLSLIEDVLHRIPEIQFSKYQSFDIMITYNNNKFIIELNSELGGTYKESEIKKIIKWDPSVKLNFLLTSYNDPHIIYKIVEFPLSDLLTKSVLLECSNLPNRFSVFTNRVFKSYAIKYENH